MFPFVALDKFWKKKSMLKFEFSKQFHAEYNKVKTFYFMLLNDLMIKTLVHFHEVLGGNLDGCLH
jgi:hypothetical protein